MLAVADTGNHRIIVMDTTGVVKASFGLIKDFFTQIVNRFQFCRLLLEGRKKDLQTGIFIRQSSCFPKGLCSKMKVP